MEGCLRAPYRVGIDGDGLADSIGVEHIGDDPGAVVDAGGAAGPGAEQVQDRAAGGLQGPEFYDGIAFVGCCPVFQKLGMSGQGQGTRPCLGDME